MTEDTSNEEISKDELICPITLELFRDPVKAKDGHVYERHAITRWILQHGTSPLTRQPLQINDLEADERLRNLARARRTSTVSYNADADQVTLPTIGYRLRNSRQIIPQTNGLNRIHIERRHYSNVITLSFLLLSFIFPVSLILGVFIGLKNSFSQELDVTSRYSGQLSTNDSTYNLSSTTNYYYYKTIEVLISVDGFYGLEIESISSVRMEGDLYQNPFNNSNIFVNLLNYAYKARTLKKTLFGNWFQSQKYILRITTYFCCNIGPFSISITGPSSVYFNPI